MSRLLVAHVAVLCFTYPQKHLCVYSVPRNSPMAHVTPQMFITAMLRAVLTSHAKMTGKLIVCNRIRRPRVDNLFTVSALSVALISLDKLSTWCASAYGEGRQEHGARSLPSVMIASPATYPLSADCLNCSTVSHRLAALTGQHDTCLMWISVKCVGLQYRQVEHELITVNWPPAT